MLAFVAIILGVVGHYAGSWGVPYFSFETERGSTCKNTMTGYTCEQLTLEDVEWYGEVQLPDDTVVKQATYTATHDFEMAALLEMPKASSGQGLKELNKAYGKCQPDHFTNLDTKGLSKLCVMANDQQVTQGGAPSSKIYNVGTGVRKDGVRVVNLSIESR